MRRDWRAFWSQQQDPRYGTDQADFARNHGREIAILLGDPGGRSILELGCGSGTLYPILEFDRARIYRGVDFSPAMLDAFRAAHPAVELICTDAAAYRDSNRYDIIFCNQVAQYLDRSAFARYVTNARAMLAPGGRIAVCSVPWKSARATYHLQTTSGGGARYLRRLGSLGLSYMGIDRIGNWHSFAGFRRIAGLNGLEVRFFGCIHYPYRFHAIFEASRQRRPD